MYSTAFITQANNRIIKSVRWSCVFVIAPLPCCYSNTPTCRVYRVQSTEYAYIPLLILYVCLFNCPRLKRVETVPMADEVLDPIVVDDIQAEFYPNYNKCDEEDDKSSTSVDSLQEYILFQSHVNADGLEESVAFSYPGTNRTITLSTKLSEDDLSPIFDGSSWAGTRVWSASIFGLKFLVEYTETIEGKSLCELGNGLGIPGMVFHMLGGNVILTEHERIMSQLSANVWLNFPQTCGSTISTSPLNWSRESFQQLLKGHRRTNHGFDIVLNCDCIFEPLYGRSWIQLAEVIDENLKINPKCLVVTSVERRAQDGIDLFLEYLGSLDHVLQVDLVAVDIKVNRRLEIYIAKGRYE